MLANSLAIPISNGSKKNHPDPTYSLPKITKRIRSEHKAVWKHERDAKKNFLIPATEQRLESPKPGKQVAEMVQTEQSEIFETL